MSAHSVALAIAVVAAAMVPFSTNAKEPSRADQVKRRLAELQKLSETDLFAKYDAAAETRWFVDKDELTREEVLVEMIRRGGGAAEKWLQMRLQTDYEKWSKFKDARAKGYEVRSLEDNLAVFAALRRVQKKPDPLSIEVAVPKDAIATTRKLPTLAVKITNTDPEQLPLRFKFGGDYRSGRQARWRIHVFDKEGRPLPLLQWHATQGGGIYSEGALKGRQAWDTELALDNYVRIPEPGEYSVQVFYHNDVTIADFDDLTGWIVFASKPTKLRVIRGERMVITVDRGEREKSQKAVAALPNEGPVRVVIDDYGADYYSFIDPRSPEGQLHELGWGAVPALLDCLRNSKSSRTRRAWCVGLLYAITKEPDLNPFFGPESDWRNVLPGYKYYAGANSGSSWGGEIDPTEQDRLVARWLKLADDYFEVRDSK